MVHAPASSGVGDDETLWDKPDDDDGDGAMAMPMAGVWRVVVGSEAVVELQDTTTTNTRHKPQ